MQGASTVCNLVFADVAHREGFEVIHGHCRIGLRDDADSVEILADT